MQAIRTALTLPALFQLPPASPSPPSQVPLHTSATAAPVCSMPAPPSLQSTCTLWPVMCPIDSSNNVITVDVAMPACNPTVLTLPPYLTMASTRLLATTLQLVRKVNAAIAAAAYEVQGRGESGACSPTVATGASPMSASMAVGLSGLHEVCEEVREVTVRDVFCL